jgi:DNA polymerase I-like protein with 3'-5' exonuclease and polymerase domains
MAGAAPSTATPESHRDVRERFKACALGIQYGMGTATLARLIGQSEAAAQQLQRSHRTAFPKFWRWSDGVEAYAVLTRRISSVFGWQLSVQSDVNTRALRNFPLQANGAEMLRLACCLATEAGARVCAPMHDALLIEAPAAHIDEVIAAVQQHMAEASRIVLDGFSLRSDVKVVRSPDRFRDRRGAAVWEAIECALQETVAAPPVHGRDATCSSVNPRPISLSLRKRGTPDAAD